MRRIAYLAAIAVVFTYAAAVQAQVQVKDAWVRATVPKQSATGVFMRLIADKETQLVAASSPVTPAVEVHQMTMDGDVMKMHAVTSLPLPAGKPVDLKSGGYHIMLMDLKQQIKAGETVPLTLTFQAANGDRQTVQLDVPVRPLNSSDAGQAGHQHDPMHDHKH
ncbi:MAG: copper chaperone PCu(A)C [Burkholderiaceae bacterium]